MTASTPPLPAYRLIMPQVQRMPVVFASPHSGRHYPQDLLVKTQLDPLRLRSSEDAFVDELLSGVTAYGAPLLLAQYPRAYVDVNRNHDEFDPALIENVPNRPAHNVRLAAGLGVIPRVVAGSRAIYRGKITMDEATQRIDEVWRPYHNALRTVLTETKRRFGQAILLDIHSMPSDAISYLGPKRPQIVLGDKFGRSAKRTTTDLLETLFVAEGLRVARNAPFAGAYIAEAYGRPDDGIEAIQIEMDRSLYMDEATLTHTSGFDRLKTSLEHIAARLAKAYGEPSLAAE